jgi:hypothetical protein
VRTVVLGPPPPELEALIARRHHSGLDRYDEVWDGEYHMAPMAHSSHGWLDQQLAVLLHPLAVAAGLHAIGAFNLGAPDDYRVPDRGLHRTIPSGVWIPTAAVVVEIESPDDETWAKLPFYAAHSVDEVLIASAIHQSLSWLLLDGDGYSPAHASRLLGPASGDLRGGIEWPPAR